MARAKLRLHEVLTYAQNIVDTIRDPLLILNSDLRVLAANRAFYQTFQVTVQETKNQLLSVLNGGSWNRPDLIALLKDTLGQKEAFDDFEVKADFPRIGQRTLLLNGRKLSRPGNRSALLVLSLDDITARAALESALAQAQVKDKQIALALQRPMLFQPKEDAFSGLVVRTAYAMASEEALVGGDFWDTFAYDHGHVALVLGDVLGHGLTSAIFTTELKHTMRAYIREHEQPALILDRMNQFTYQSNRLFREGINAEGSDAPVCITLAVLDRETGAGTLAVAGMEAPVLVRADGATEQMIAGGLPLGIEPHAEYEQIDFQLEASDTLILFTDGITEARQERRFLEVAGLMHLAVGAKDAALKQMADQILQGARDFAGGKLQDDASIVLARRTTHSPQLQQKGSSP